MNGFRLENEISCACNVESPDLAPPTRSKTESPVVSPDETPAARPDCLRIARLIDVLRTPACHFDENGRVVSINDAWLAYADRSAEATYRLQWTELIHPEHRCAAQSTLHAAQSGSVHETLECRLAGSHGIDQWFTVDLHRVDCGWLCTCTNIHDLKAKEIELKSHTSIQTDMLNISIDCIKLISPTGNLLHMNRAGCQALGVDEDSGFGMPWLPLLPEDVWPDGNVALESARNGVFGRFPGRSERPGRDVQYWDNMLTPILDADGKTTAILCVSRDVTRERVALDLLRRSEERLAIAARVGGLGIWDYDIASDTLHCDENWHRIMGHAPGRAITSIDQFRALIHPDDVDKAMKVTRTAEQFNSFGRDYRVEYRVIQPNGEIRWVQSTAYPQHEDGVTQRTIGFVLDVTKIRLAERRREAWLHFISHDMRSPQASILALIDLQRAAEPAPPAKDLLDRIAAYARRTLALADDFVLLARAEAPTWSLVETDIGSVVLDAIDELWALAQARGIRLDVNVGDEICIARVEPFLLMRAVVNLVSNAIKFSPGNATVTVRLTGVEHGYAISVADHGPGISAEAQQRLFEPFQRLQVEPPRYPSGAGLGLAFVKTIAKRYGGNIDLHTRPGEGCTFILTLPGVSSIHDGA
ncbi:ATP-binding protein [Burkholderia sp. SCN-KJ]|uniref:PAS domain-containing sensor histidine kinase n=1 Tax=Burkholderia sp. SCN-KJ TaxID=2969248 RepID=UPI0021506636|nr:ATP-binding protein [Burkholderia sp. SCN-KJ]MCR4471112.1 PAS domain-containing protein [Burkholderia sp. SCN-KJ]